MNTSKTILIVEDSTEHRQHLSDLIQDAGYAAIIAVDGVDGYAAALRTHPDLIISGVTMPRMDGLQFCRAVRQAPSLSVTPVLLVGGVRRYAKGADEALLAGADDYIERPFDRLHLVSKIGRLIERKRVSDAIGLLGQTVVRLEDLVRKYIRLVRNAAATDYLDDSHADDAGLSEAERAELRRIAAPGPS
jgi:two-component system C4-dicarboxylate transport response regulator DctD